MRYQRLEGGFSRKCHAWLLLLLVVLSTADGQVEAQVFRSTLSAGELLDRCSSTVAILVHPNTHHSWQETMLASYCAGFAEAAADAGSFIGALDAPEDSSESAVAQNSVANCAGPQVDAAHLVNIVLEFIENTPQSNEQGAIVVGMLAIARAFPCEQTKIQSMHDRPADTEHIPAVPRAASSRPKALTNAYGHVP